MERWQRNLQIAATGVVAAALIEAVIGRKRRRVASIARCLLAGGVAYVYAQLTPPVHWGARSGAAFAQLPWVAALESSLAGAGRAELAAWGGLTGAFLRLQR